MNSTKTKKSAETFSWLHLKNHHHQASGEYYTDRLGWFHNN